MTSNRSRALSPATRRIVEARLEVERHGRDFRAFIGRLDATARQLKTSPSGRVRQLAEQPLKDATAAGRALWDALAKLGTDLVLLERVASAADNAPKPEDLN